MQLTVRSSWSTWCCKEGKGREGQGKEGRTRGRYKIKIDAGERKTDDKRIRKEKIAQSNTA